MVRLANAVFMNFDRGAADAWGPQTLVVARFKSRRAQLLSDL